MSRLVSADEIRDAAKRVEGVVLRTPLHPAPWLDEADGTSVRLKCENLQRVGAFKARDAFNMVARLPEAERRRGVITYSSGNHGQATAFAARRFGVPAVVVMPTTAPRVKVEGARALGAEVVFEGTTSVERKRRAEAIAAERGLTMVPPFDHPDVIAGQGTVAVEILEQWPEVEAVLVPIGGGGLASGIAAWLKQTRPEVRVVGVEPEAADAMRRSLEAGAPVTVESRPSIADGLLPVRPGDLTFEHARAYLDEVVTVDDEAIREAARALLTRSRLMVEFSGAATVAAILSGRWAREGRNTVAVLSGGNMDPGLVPGLLGAG